MVLDGPRSDPIPVRWNQVIAIREVWTLKTFAHCSYRNMLGPAHPAIGREMRSLAPAALAATWPKLRLIKEIILAYAGRADPAGEER